MMEMILVIGGVFCPKSKAKKINKEIRKIKEKYKIGLFAEIKWHKVSNNKLDFYKELVEYLSPREKGYLLNTAYPVIYDRKILQLKKANESSLS